MNKAAKKRLADMAKGQKLCHRRKRDLDRCIHLHDKLRGTHDGRVMVVLDEVAPFTLDTLREARKILDAQPVPLRPVLPTRWQRHMIAELQAELPQLTEAEIKAIMFSNVQFIDGPTPSRPSQGTTYAPPPTLAEERDHQPELVARVSPRPKAD